MKKVTAVRFVCVIIAVFTVILPLSVCAEAAAYNSYRSDFPESSFDNAGEECKAEPIAFNGSGTLEECDGKVCSRLSLEGDGIVYGFNTEKAGAYCIQIEYKPLKAQEKSVEIGFLLDGQYPFEDAKSIKLPRYWENDGGKRITDNGDEIAPHQKESFLVSRVMLRDAVGLNNEPLAVLLESGSHTLEIKLVNEALLIFEVKLVALNAPEKYERYIEKTKKPAEGENKGECVVIEGEDAVYKTSKSIVAKSDGSCANVSPNNAFKNVLNFIGSDSWANNGDSIVWSLDIPCDGMYTVGFNYRQNYVLDGYSYRRLEIDGEIPFYEASQIGFAYNTTFENTVFADKNGNPYELYLTKGKHTFSLTVTMGPLCELNGELADVVLELGSIYRKITMVVGENADANRDYNLFGQISGLKEQLEKCSKNLKRISADICSLSGVRSNSSSVVLQNMANVIDRMLKNPFRATDYKTDYYNNYCSMGSVLYEMRKTALDIDTITFSQEGNSGQKVSFVKRTLFSFGRFFASFVSDYSDLTVKENNKDEISLWINWGRDQAQVLNSLIDESFTPESHIKVNVKLTNASLIQSMLSGNGTDIYLRMPRSQPVNMAIRGALYDLSEFDDYNEVEERFMPTATVPYRFNNGIYALPDTQTFFIMFYRKDIFEELGLAVPKTWDEFIKVMTVISRNNMQVGIPYTQFNGAAVADEGIGALNLFASFVLQNGGKIYNEKLTETTFDAPVTLEAFKTWVSLYTEYKMPVTFDFYNRFRSGEMPLAIQPYTQYTTLSVAALEINGLWGMAPVPATVLPDGTENRTVTGGGTGSVILNNSKHKKSAWEFLKWWTDADTQANYVDEIESILGVAARQPTANREALKKLSWENDDLEILLEQWSYVEEVPEIVGSYDTSRSLDQAFWSVYNNSTNPRDTLSKWGDTVNSEISRKRAEYGF